jgi:hypothetical protein
MVFRLGLFRLGLSRLIGYHTRGVNVSGDEKETKRGLKRIDHENFQVSMSCKDPSGYCLDNNTTNITQHNRRAGAGILHGCACQCSNTNLVATSACTLIASNVRSILRRVGHIIKKRVYYRWNILTRFWTWPD